LIVSKEVDRMSADAVPEPQTVESEPRSKSDAGSPDQLKYLLEREGLAPNLISTWASSPERTWYMERRRVILLWCAGGVALILAAIWVATITLKQTELTPERIWGVTIAAVGLIMLCWSTVPYWAARRAYGARRRASARYRVDDALTKLREAMESDSASSKMQLARMFELNRGQLDEYQQLTKRQQRTAFVLTWGASVAALLILVAGSIVAIRVGDENKYITAGLTALGTLLSAFLGKTFFKGHEKAMDQLNHYYQEPSLTGRLLAAERLLNQLPPEERAKKAAEIMNKLLDWEPPPEKPAPEHPEESAEATPGEEPKPEAPRNKPDEDKTRANAQPRAA
jgi:hypothetical protein